MWTTDEPDRSPNRGRGINIIALLDIHRTEINQLIAPVIHSWLMNRSGLILEARLWRVQGQIPLEDSQTVPWNRLHRASNRSKRRGIKHCLLISTLLNIKDTDIRPLKFEAQGYKPMESERWILSVERVMNGYHPEIAADFWKSPG